MTYKVRIYKITCDEIPNDIYVGSTTMSLNRRMSDHFSHSKTRNNKLYQFMRKYGAENFMIELLEERKIDYEFEGKMGEREYYDVLQPTLNEISPYLTEEEVKENRKDRDYHRKKYIINHRKNYRYENKKQGKYRCEICKENYMDKYNLDRHFKTQKHEIALARFNRLSSPGAA